MAVLRWPVRTARLGPNSKLMQNPTSEAHVATLERFGSLAYMDARAEEFSIRRHVS